MSPSGCIPTRRAGAPRGPALVLSAAALLVGCGSREAAFRTFVGDAMATRWEVVLPDRPDAASTAEAVFARWTELDLELSEWKQGSPLSAVNRAAGVEPVVVPRELYALVERSLELGRATDGAFDISWAALWGIWDFRAAEPRVPEAGTIAARLPLVDCRKVRLDPERSTLFLPEAGMKLGLGAVGKGYALDQARALLEGAGFHDFLLVGGGQVLARGSRGGRPWRVGIRDPRGLADEYFARVEPGDASLSTTADNESFFVVDGVRYHHVIDPRTGWPARGLRSVTVLADDGTLADALSTALMVLGRKRGLEVARRLGVEALMVDDRGGVETTPGWGRRLERLRDPRTE